MTSIGFAILDYFTQSLEVKHASGKGFLTVRDSFILKKMYSWEEWAFATEKEIAKELKLTSERIRQIKHKALRKVRVAAKKGRNPAQKIITIIEGSAGGNDSVNIYKAILNLCITEMADLPALILIKLLAELYFNKKADVQATCDCYLAWKKRIEKERRQSGEEDKKLNYVEHLKDELTRNIIWFDRVRKWKREDFIGKEPKRKVNESDNYYSGEFFSHKCNKPVQYESRIELNFIRKLEANPDVVYYLEQPVTISYTRHRINRSYTPDFAILLQNGHCFITEIKHSCDDMLDARVHRRLEALIEFCEKYGMGLLLTNGRYSLDYLMKYPCNDELEQILQNKLNERRGRTIFSKEFKEIRARYNVKKIEILALILKNNWGYYPYPLKLTPKSCYLVFREKVIDRLRLI